MIRRQIWIPIVAVLLALSVFGLIIYKHEKHLSGGRIIYVKLAPIDPRSLVQGDYMRLGYELYISQDTSSMADYPPKITAKVALDDLNKVISTDLDGKVGDVYLKLKNTHTSWRGVYPAVNSFMFAEGLGECYQDATYAKLSLLDDGESMLVDLVGDDLQSLGCEQGHRWRDGIIKDR